MEQLTQEKIKLERTEYYSHIFVRFEILKCLRGREFAVLDKFEHKGNIRYMNVLNYDYLLLYFEKLRLVSRNLTFYHSVANLKNLPHVNFNLRTRMKEKDYIDFDKNFENNMTGFNFFMDFDGKENFEQCYKEVKEFKSILEEMKISYYILNSSSRGFHIIIPSFLFDESNIPENVKLFNKIGNNIKIIYGFETLDTSIWDSHRICKLPYSYVEDGTIALPLDDKMFNEFSIEMVKCPNVLQKIKIKNRGLLIREYGLSKDKLKENVDKFVKEFS